MRARIPILAAIVVASCITSDSLEERSGWGLNDEADCSDGSLACWPSADVDRIRDVSTALEEVILEAPEARGAALARAAESALALGAKLTPEQNAALEADVRELAAAGFLDDEQLAAAVRDVRADGVLDLEAGMIGAHTAPLETVVAAQTAGLPAAAAGAIDPFDFAKDVVIPNDYPQELQKTLKDMMTTPLGTVTAAMLIITGVLREDYRVENAKLFGEYIAPVPAQPARDGHAAVPAQPARFTESGLSPEAKVTKIIHRADWLAAGVGAATQGGSLLLPPAAGALAGASLEMFLLFRIHMAMAMRIAQVYRWDVLRGPELLMLVAHVQFEGLAGSAADQFVSYSVSSYLIEKVVKSEKLQHLGLASVDDVMKFLFTGLWDRMKTIWSREAAEAAAREVAERGGTALFKQFFGWATFGAMIAVSAGLDAALTHGVGERLRWTTRHWMIDLLREGSTAFGKREIRDCAFELYGRIAEADGTLHEHEKKLLLGYLATRYFVDETAERAIGPEEIEDQARTVRAAVDRGAATTTDPAQVQLPACVGEALADADEQHRTVFLAHIEAMMQIDLDEDARERAIYNKVREALAAGWFRRVDDELLDDVERSVQLEVGVARGVVVQANGRQYNTATDFGLTIEDIVPAMKDDVLRTVIEPFQRGWGTETFLQVPAAAAQPPAQPPRSN